MSTILVLAIALYSHERIPLPPKLKTAFYITTILASVFQALLNPPNTSDFLKYANGFLSLAYALRAFELLIVHDLTRLKRLEKVPLSRRSSKSAPNYDQYSWNPMPPAWSYRRLGFVWDLLVNPRAIGWSHGSGRYVPRLQPIDQPSGDTAQIPSPKQTPEQTIFIILESPQHYSGSRAAFLRRETVKILSAYLIFDAYQTAFVRHYPGLCGVVRNLISITLLGLGTNMEISPQRSEYIVQRFLLPPACWLACYAFLDGVHALVALFSVGGMHVLSPQLSGEPWMYPPIFGSWRHILISKLREIWGKTWHDLCRRTLLTSSASLTPHFIPDIPKRVLIVFLTFVISGFVHAAGAYAVCRKIEAALMMIAFFVLLPVCIILQEAMSGWLLVQFLPSSSKVSKVIIWVSDFAFLLTWGYYTSPLFFSYSMLPESLAVIPVPIWVFERFVAS